jgi:hypothetical protein
VPCEATRHLVSQAIPLLEEARALSFALAMTLAATPRQELGGDEVDALCQLSYELQSKLTTAADLLHDIERVSER